MVWKKDLSDKKMRSKANKTTRIFSDPKLSTALHTFVRTYEPAEAALEKERNILKE